MFNNAYKLKIKNAPSTNFVNTGGVVINGKLTIITMHYIVWLDIASRCLDIEQDLSLIEGKAFNFDTLKLLHKKSLWIADITEEGIKVDDKGNTFFINYDGELVSQFDKLYVHYVDGDMVRFPCLDNIVPKEEDIDVAQNVFAFNADFLSRITATFKTTEGVPDYRIAFAPWHRLMIYNSRGQNYTDYALLMQCSLENV